MFEQVTWRQDSKGTMTSHFTVIQVRPSVKKASQTAPDQADGRSRWDGMLPVRTLLVERPGEAGGRTGYWMSNLPADTPRSPTWCGGRRCAGGSSTTTANSSTAWAWTTSKVIQPIAGPLSHQQTTDLKRTRQTCTRATPKFAHRQPSTSSFGHVREGADVNP
ncbi:MULTISPECIES: hypothetical protein [unclassified Streptomyces]|uniref:hypothetical protein n=1 Tax=unclassified Streptomyces TaxID=2593676 RepID=UPI000AD898E4|nr:MULTISPECIES: hypothetical protein [unclassified Streptomyces]